MSLICFFLFTVTLMMGNLHPFHLATFKRFHKIMLKFDECPTVYSYRRAILDAKKRARVNTAMNYTSIPMPNASNTRLMLLEVIVPLLIEPLLIPCTDSPKTAHIAWQPSSAILTCFSSLFLRPLASAGNFSIEQRPLCLAAALLDP